MTTKTKLAVALIGIPASLLALAAIGVALFAASKTAELNHERQLAQADPDFPKSLEDLWPKWTPADNAADLYKSVFPEFDLESAHTIPDFPKGNIDLEKPEDRARLKDYLDEARPYLDKAIAASYRPVAHFDHSAEKPGQAKFNEFSPIRAIVKDFCYSANLELRAGKKAQALADLTAAARIAQQTGRSPALIAKLVQVALDSVILVQLERLLTMDPSQASAYQAVLAALGPEPDLKTALRYEYFKTVHEPVAEQMKAVQDISNIKSGPDGAPADGSGKPNLIIPGTGEAQAARYLQHIRGLIESTSRLEDHRKLEQAIFHLASTVQSSKSWEDHLSQTLVPILDQSAKAANRDVSRRRITAQAIAILSSGQTPSKLPLTGDWAVDPFNNKPLNLKPIPGGFRIWAIGFSGKPLGGTRAPSPMNSDLCFDYPYTPPTQPTKIRPTSASPS